MLGTYFSCLAPDELVRLCLFRFLGRLPGALVGHHFAQLIQLLLFLILSERFDLERVISGSRFFVI